MIQVELDKDGWHFSKWTCFGVMVPKTLDYPTINLIRAKVHCMITMHTCPRWTERQTSWQYCEDSF